MITGFVGYTVTLFTHNPVILAYEVSVSFSAEWLGENQSLSETGCLTEVTETHSCFSHYSCVSAIELWKMATCTVSCPSRLYIYLNRLGVYFYSRMSVYVQQTVWDQLYSFITVQFELVVCYFSLGMSAATNKASIELDFRNCSYSKNNWLCSSSLSR